MISHGQMPPHLRVEKEPSLVSLCHVHWVIGSLFDAFPFFCCKQTCLKRSEAAPASNVGCRAPMRVLEREVGCSTSRRIAQNLHAFSELCKCRNMRRRLLQRRHRVHVHAILVHQPLAAPAARYFMASCSGRNPTLLPFSSSVSSASGFFFLAPSGSGALLSSASKADNCRL